MAKRPASKTPSSTKRCFVICPIGDEGSEIRKRSDQVFQYAIKPAALECGYNPTRADLFDIPGMITTHIIEHLLEDDLVIADLTYKNPNVFYELAIRHAENKPVIQIKEYSESIPFDITSMRTIDLDYRYVKSLEKCRDDLILQIRAVENERNKKNSISLLNPVSMTKSLKNKDSEQNRIINELIAENQNLKRKEEARKAEITTVKTSYEPFIFQTNQYPFKFDEPLKIGDSQFSFSLGDKKAPNSKEEKKNNEHT